MCLMCQSCLEGAGSIPLLKEKIRRVMHVWELAFLYTERLSVYYC